MVDYMPTVLVTPLCVYMGAVVMTSILPTYRPPGRVGYVLYSDSGSLGSTTPVNPDDLHAISLSLGHPVGYYRYVII